MIDIIPHEKSLENKVADMILHIQREEFGVPITAAEQPDLFIVEDFYKQGGGNFWVALAGNEVVGSIALIRIGNNHGAIRKMFVKSEFRGKAFGTAQKLLDTLLTFCRETGITTVSLGTVGVFEAAIRFYEKNGFYRIEKEELPEDFPKMRLDHIFFQNKL